MQKPTRSPLLGYNHNVKYRGRIFHVQTEDSGPANPHLFTHLYYEGTILASKRHEYDALSAEDVVRALMQGQHKSILKELKHGSFDLRLDQFFAARGETLEPPFDAEMATPRALDLDAVAPEPPPPLEVPPPSALGTRPPTGTGTYAVRGYDESPLAAPGLTPRPVVAPAGAPAPKRRSTAPAIPAAGVVVQRTVVVGGGAPPTRQPGQPVVAPPRTRRPAQSIPYVVKEGSHPTLATPAQAAPSSDPPAAAPTPRAVPPPLPGTTAPRTSAVPPRAPEPVADKSLDEVILAYLAQGGQTDK